LPVNDDDDDSNDMEDDEDNRDDGDDNVEHVERETSLPRYVSLSRRGDAAIDPFHLFMLHRAARRIDGRASKYNAQNNMCDVDERNSKNESTWNKKARGKNERGHS